MISNCPHCQKTLNFNAGQQAKLQKAINALKPGKKLTIKCPHCKKPIHLDNEQETAAATKAAEPAPNPSASAKEKKVEQAVRPPTPPDLEWLKTGSLQAEEKVRDVPMALILHNDPEVRDKLKASMDSLGYRSLIAQTAEEAIDQTRFVTFACIVLHTEFEQGGLKASNFHNYMCQMPMKTRRYIYYILYGPDFHSLYDMEALACSANLVVAEKDIQYFDLILHKAIPAYENLFGPFLEEIGNYGGR